MGCARHDPLRTVIHHRSSRVAQSAGGIDDVVHDHAIAVFHVADEVHDLADVGLVAPLVDDGQRSVEPLGIRARTLHAPCVGGYEHGGRVERPLEVVLQKHRQRVQMIERDVEKSLDLSGVEIHTHDASDTCGHQHVSDEFARDRSPRRDLAILTRVAVVGNHRGDGRSAGAAQRVAQDEKLHQALVHRRASRLNDVGVEPPHVLADLAEGLTVTEARHACLSERCIEHFADFRREVGIRIPGENTNRLIATLRLDSPTRAP